MSIKILAINIMKKSMTISILTLFLISCSALTGEEIARLQINRVSANNNITAKEVMLDLNKGDEIAFWSDMDMEYDGVLQIRFKVKIFNGRTKVFEFDIDPTNKNITLGELKSTIMDKTKWSFSGKNHVLTIEEDASYRVSSILVASENPSLKITKAELVIKK